MSENTKTNPGTHAALDAPTQGQALQQATERAEKAEAELARLQHESSEVDTARQSRPAQGSRSHVQTSDSTHSADENALRDDSMMAHLLDSLADGKDIGHYGRLVFAMVARHFMDHDKVVGWLTRDPDFSEEQARVMLHQVEGRDYNPPRRERILAWQREQEFPILPHPEDPDCGNLYRNLKFPDHVYQGIEQYQEAKMDAGE